MTTITTIPLQSTATSTTGSPPAASTSATNNATSDGYYGLRYYMALGDSFSAGNGAGDLVSPDQPNCRRTDGSYVYQLLNDQSLWGFNLHPQQFEFNACSGAITTQVENFQILNPAQQSPPFNPFIYSADLYTLSAGGNDLGFDTIVRTCVYNFGLWGSCAKALANVDTLLTAGSTFDQNLQALYQTLDDNSGPGQVIIIPYIQFYNADVSQSIFGCKVSQSIRQQMNQKVLDVNSFIASRASPFHGFSVVDNGALQSAFDGHRFCDPVDQSEIWIQDSFFESLSNDTQQQYNSNGALPASVAAPLNSTLTSDGNLNGDDNGDDNSGLSNIFHPTKAGHTAYYQLVKDALSPASNSNNGSSTDGPAAVVDNTAADS
ncbi:hypothetical protein P7C71_g2264, partial [Lecanoromycetidae sp. Uapishka_2]